jgi:hypothetical protein
MRNRDGQSRSRSRRNFAGEDYLGGAGHEEVVVFGPFDVT